MKRWRLDGTITVPVTVFLREDEIQPRARGWRARIAELAAERVADELLAVEGLGSPEIALRITRVDEVRDNPPSGRPAKITLYAALAAVEEHE